MPEGAYQGRLAYDSDSDFHVDPDGYPVLTEDNGKSWRYAAPGELSHYDRYHTGDIVGVNPTANVEADLLAKYGSDRADEVKQLMTDEHPHHYEPNDPRFVPAARSHPDSTAPTVTGHTEAYSG